jgi:hypothetical protein
MNITGTLIEIYDAQQVSEKFKKREFVIQDNENPQYPQYIKFELAQEKCSLLDTFSNGDMVDVSFNLRGRSYVNPQGVKSYFNSLQAWKLQSISSGSGSVANTAASPRTESVSLPPLTEDDGLPF